MVNYVDDPENGGGSDDGGSQDGAGDDGKGDGGSDGGDGDGAGKGDDDKSQKKDTPENKFTRWKISQAKKQAAKEVIDGGKKDPESAKMLEDQEFNKMIDDLVAEKVAEKVGSQDNSEIQTIKERLEKDDFFNQFKEAGEQFTEYGMTVDPKKGAEILSDIEENGFSPEHLILLANAETIIGKLKGIPKAPTTTDNGQRPKVDTSKMSMTDRVSALREKWAR